MQDPSEKLLFSSSRWREINHSQQGDELRQLIIAAHSIRQFNGKGARNRLSICFQSIILKFGSKVNQELPAVRHFLLFLLKSMHEHEIDRDEEHFDDDFNKFWVFDEISFLVVLKARLINY